MFNSSTRTKPARPRGRKTKALAFERLESRELMAGNVRAYMDSSSGVLHLHGDALANSVTVTRQDGPLNYHTYEVKGFSTGTGSQHRPTAINGIGGDVFRNVAHIEAHLGGGNDTIVIGATVNLDGRPDLHNITIHMGTGQEEYVRIGYLDVSGHVEINTGSGAAVVGLQENSLQSAAITTGNSADLVKVEWTMVAQGLTVNTRGGDDLFHVNNSKTSSNWRRVGDLRVDLGAGKDRMNLHRVVVDYIYTELGAGDDYLDVGSADLRSGRIHGQAGKDSWWYSGPVTGRFSRLGFELQRR